MPRRRRAIIIACAVAIALAAGLAALRWLASAVRPPGETTDVAAYPSTLKQWSGSGLVAHFPASIPPQARNVWFAAAPGYLQAGAYIQLR